MKIILFILIFGLVSLMYSLKMFPVIPEIINDAKVEFDCAHNQTCSIVGTLKKSFAGTYTIRNNESTYYEWTSENLISAHNGVYRFKDGYIR